MAVADVVADESIDQKHRLVCGHARQRADDCGVHVPHASAVHGNVLVITGNREGEKKKNEWGKK